MLRDYPKDLTLKDGTTVKVRPLEKTDGPALLAFFRDLPEEDRLFLKEDVTDASVVERFTANLDYETVLPLVAMHEGKIVGDGTIHRQRFGWKSHVGKIRVVVARPFQRRGLGRALAKQLVSHAISMGLDKLVAEVVDNQVTAKKAFERIGFKQEALLKDHVKDTHGMKRNLVLMANDVSHIWESVEDLHQEYLPTQE